MLLQQKLVVSSYELIMNGLLIPVERLFAQNDSGIGPQSLTLLASNVWTIQSWYLLLLVTDFNRGCEMTGDTIQTGRSAWTEAKNARVMWDILSYIELRLVSIQSQLYSITTVSVVGCYMCLLLTIRRVKSGTASHAAGETKSVSLVLIINHF